MLAVSRLPICTAADNPFYTERRPTWNQLPDERWRFQLSRPRISGTSGLGPRIVGFTHRASSN